MASVLSTDGCHSSSKNMLTQSVDSIRDTIWDALNSQRIHNQKVAVKNKVKRLQRIKRENSTEEQKSAASAESIIDQSEHDLETILKASKDTDDVDGFDRENERHKVDHAMSRLGPLLISLASSHFESREFHEATHLYQEAVLVYKELNDNVNARVSKVSNLESDWAKQQIELADSYMLSTADAMCLLARCVYEEGLTIVGGSYAPLGLLVPDGIYRFAVQLLERAIEYYNDLDLDRTHVAAINALQILARIHFLQLQHDSAREAYESTMKIFMEVKGVGHILVARTLIDYGILCGQVGEVAEGCLLLQQANDLYRRRLYNLPDTRYQMAVNMLNQSGMFIDIGNHEEAQTAVEGAISLFEEIQRDEEGMVSRCSEPNLSEVETPKSAVHSSMNTPNVDPPENAVIAESEKRIINNAVECHLANCYNYLGLIHHHYEEYEEAKAAYKESVLLYERTGEAESLDIANVYNNLGTLMDDMGEADKAKAVYEQAVVVLFRNHGRSHPQILTTLENLMNLLNDMGLREEYNSLEENVASLEGRLVRSMAEAEERKKYLNAKYSIHYRSMEILDNTTYTTSLRSFRAQGLIAKGAIDLSNVSVCASGISPSADVAFSSLSAENSLDMTGEWRGEFLAQSRVHFNLDSSHSASEDSVQHANGEENDLPAPSSCCVM